MKHWRVAPNPWGGVRNRTPPPPGAGGEQWAGGKHGIYIAEGSRHDERTDVYVEDNASLRTEKDVFEFFHLEYLEPREREC